ncbi:MAG: DUF5063 domain-containing protein [Bacteroidetes bacterium]|nr:DUF5063 domain-containing protein [Bacteroidota bacterium]
MTFVTIFAYKFLNSMNSIPDLPVYSKNVFELLTVANDFCLTLSRLENTDKATLIDYLRKVSPLLYLKASLLPDIKVENPDANEKFLTQEEWEYLFNALRKKFGADDEFWFIDPGKADNEAVKGSLSECFADIYQDLKDFLTLYQKNSLSAKENAVYEIKNLFENRWGYDLVNAHKTLHYLTMPKGRRNRFMYND